MDSPHVMGFMNLKSCKRVGKGDRAGASVKKAVKLPNPFRLR